MFGQISSANCCGPLAQVWACLAAERRARVIRLLAQLALNLVAAQPEWSTEELAHDPSSRCS